MVRLVSKYIIYVEVLSCGSIEYEDGVSVQVPDDVGKVTASTSEKF